MGRSDLDVVVEVNEHVALAAPGGRRTTIEILGGATA